MKKIGRLLVLMCIGVFAHTQPVWNQVGPDRILTVAVLVNAANPTGYNTNPTTPGEFQRYPERYLEHLQVPYEIFDVSSEGPPSDLSTRQLILAGHRGLTLSAAWQTAIRNAVNGGVGFVNLDWDVTIGNQSHIQNIFGASGSSAGTPDSAITVPAAVQMGGTTPHFITALQEAFDGDVVNASGDIVYDFHPDENNTVQSVTSTVLTGPNGVVLARIGADPFIVATAFGQGRAVYFGTLEYLKADRFGFLLGVDDLFWRSLVWAARKPFIMRGYPRLWAIQMDDTNPDWGFRVKDLYNTSLTGNVAPDGTGGPWKVTGYVFTNHLTPGTSERASVIADIQQGSLQISPHSFAGAFYGDLYWNGANGELTDAQWLANLNAVQQWRQGLGGNDAFPSFSRSMVGHWWDISDNTGFDLWNTLGFRYVTGILRPGFQKPYEDVTIYGGAERLDARPFWSYEKPRKITTEEDFPFFFADDYPINSRAGLPSKTLFLFTTQLQDPGFYPRSDISWPITGSSVTVSKSIEQFKRMTWRFWSSLAPVQIFTHDASNYALASPANRQEVIRQVSSWLLEKGVNHVFMEQLGDYSHSRTKSVLTNVELSGNNVTYTFTGNATTADSDLINTQVLVFFDGSSEGVSDTVPGFIGGTTFTQPLPPPPPIISSITPTSGSVDGGTNITITGANFTNVTAVRIAENAVTNLVVVNTTTLTATTPLGLLGPANVVVSTDAGTATLFGGFTYIGPPEIEAIEPDFGPAAGGTQITITGEGFEPTSAVRIGGVLATNITFITSSTLKAVTPAGVSGFADVRVTNSQGTTTLPDGFFYYTPSDFIRLNFTYASRQALLAAGWDFIAQTASGETRNTEQTTGLVVSYNQTTHPGVIRIPVDAGDLFQEMNDTRNTLFFDLSNGWRSIRLKIAQFNPTAPLQMVALVAYQNDDNYVLVNRYMDGGDHQVMEFATENSGQYFVTELLPAPVSSALFLRLDRSVSTNVISAFSSTDGVNWTHLSGSTTTSLVNPRLGILVGANQSLTSFPATDIAFVDILQVNAPPVIGITPQNMSFSAITGGTNPPSQTLTINNTGDGVVNWTATENVSWLSLSPVSGTAPSSVNVSTNVSGLAAGIYNTNITITDPNASNSPQTVPVTLTITPPPAPTLSGISPGSGPVAGGTAVVLSGSGFTAGSTVTIGGASATNVVVTSASSISAVTPARPAGLADVVVSTSTGTVTLAGGFHYVVPGDVLFSDDFSDGVAEGWTISPLGQGAGWSVVNGVYTFDGRGHTQAYRGDAGWSDYTVEADIRLTTLNNYPGGLRGRVNPATGAGYAVWLYPASGEIRLWRATAWNVNSPGLTQLGVAGGIVFDTTAFHRLRVSFSGTTIEVYYDGVLVLSATDTAYSSGLVALDVENQPLQYDNIVVTFGVPLALSGLSPAQGPIAGGTAVVLSGSGFTAGSTVTIGGVSATNVVVTSASSISAVTPARPAGLADVVVSTGAGSATLAGGFRYVGPGDVLFSDDFSDGVAEGWTISPLGQGAGWSVVNGVYTFDGRGHTQAYRGDAGWSDYTVEVDIRLTTLNNYPGGLRGRVNPATGAGYVVWLYPASGEMRLWRATAWNVNSPGLTQLGVAGGIVFDTTAFHRLRVSFSGTTIEVYYDGVLVLSATDTAYSSGLVALDVENQPLQYDNIVVTFGTPPGPPALTSLTVLPTSMTLTTLGATQQLQVTGHFADGSSQDVTTASATTYSSDSSTVASVNGTGLITATSDGGATITIANNSVNTTASVTVDTTGNGPTLSGLSPAQGPIAGGTAVVLSGSGFTAGSTVTIGGASATNVVVTSASSISAVTPARPAGLADVVVSTSTGTVTLAGGFHYVVPGDVLFSDDFSDGVAEGWTISPLGQGAGWSVVNGVYTFDGRGHTQAYRGDAGWSDYTVEADIRLTTLNNYPGGLRGRVNPATGAGYAVWLYPASGEIRLWRATAWNVNSPGLTQLGVAGGIVFDTTAFHRLRVSFSGTTIEVYYDGVLVLSATDTAYSSGLVALDVENQPLQYDNIVVTLGVPLRLDEISPAQGPIAGGTAVVLSGSGFTAGSTVTIGGVSATNVVVTSASSISAVTPARPAGLADVVVSTGAGSATLAGGFRYVGPGDVLFSDDFSDEVAEGWTISPLGHGVGWSVVNGTYTFDGQGHTQSYASETFWDNYTVEVDIRLTTLNNYPGGLRGRVNPATGAGYVVWLYPASGEMRLWRTTAWNINSPGLTPLNAASGIAFDTTTFHKLRMRFSGTTIEVYYDGVLVLSATDTAYSSGLVALDVENQAIAFDSVMVNTLP